jgi:hypothetical protein
LRKWKRKPCKCVLGPWINDKPGKTAGEKEKAIHVIGRKILI